MDTETARKDLLNIKENVALIAKLSTEANWSLKQPERPSFGQEVALLVQLTEDTVVRFEDAFGKNATGVRHATSMQKLMRAKLFTFKMLGENDVLPGSGLPDQPVLKDTLAKLFTALDGLADLNARYPEPRMAATVSSHPVFGDLTLPEWVSYLKLLTKRAVSRLDHIVRFSPYPG